MTKTRYTLLKVCTLVWIALSCSKDDSTEVKALKTVTFGYSQRIQETTRTNSSQKPSKARISINDISGEEVYDGLVVKLFEFGAGFVSESVELHSGEYALSLFQILDEDDNVIMVTPLEGSEKAEEVDDPLPIYFEVAEKETNRVTPEVLLVGNDENPILFGYAQFGFEIANDFSLDLGVISDYDSTYVPSTITFKAYSDNNNVIDEKTLSYHSGVETIDGLIETAHFYEVSISAPSFHDLNYYIQTSDLLDIELLAFRLSPEEFTYKYTVIERSDEFGNEVNLYLPKDGCLSYARFDRTGTPLFYFFLSSATEDQETGLSLTPPNIIESFTSNPNNIYFPSNQILGSKAESTCDAVFEEFPDEPSFYIEIFIYFDDGSNVEFFEFNWNSVTSLWEREVL